MMLEPDETGLAVVYHLAVWRELRETLAELAEVGRLELELAAGMPDETGLAVDCRRWRLMREARVRELATRLVA